MHTYISFPFVVQRSKRTELGAPVRMGSSTDRSKIDQRSPTIAPDLCDFKSRRVLTPQGVTFGVTSRFSCRFPRGPERAPVLGMTSLAERAFSSQQAESSVLSSYVFGERD